MDARRLPATHGIIWLAAGFALFRRNPPRMTTLTFAYLLIVVMINLIPKIGPVILPLILPILTVMLANGCRAVQLGREFSSDVMIEGIPTQRVGLLRLGGLHLLGSSILMLISLSFGEPVNAADGLDESESAALLADLGVLLVLASPLLMAFWFAPLLTAWNGISAGKSVFFSFVASWRNWRAFATYGLALGVVGVLIPGSLIVIAGMISPALLQAVSLVLRMLLIFVLAPTLIASVYLSYRDVFAPPVSIDVVA